MAGPLDIQRVPTGLLDLLGLKAMGLGPVALNENVSATLADCVDYYLASRRVTLTGTTGVVLAANTNYLVNNLTVPAGEIWFCYGVSAALNTASAAATAVRFWCGLLRSSSANFVALTPTASVGATDNESVSRIFTRPFIWMPGDQGYIVTGAVTGAPGALGRMTLDVARLTL